MPPNFCSKNKNCGHKPRLETLMKFLRFNSDDWFISFVVDLSKNKQSLDDTVKIMTADIYNNTAVENFQDVISSFIKGSYC